MRNPKALWAILFFVLAAGTVAFVELNKPVPFCKIVDGREIDNHHCIPYCPPDPSECGD